MVPGVEIEKDPALTVIKGSEDCWVFVKVEKSNNFDDFMIYEIAEEWTALDSADGVYYQKVINDDVNDQVLQVLKGDAVFVKDDVTKDMLNALDEDPANVTYPTLTFTGYAVQAAEMATAADAWAAANPTVTP